MALPISTAPFQGSPGRPLWRVAFEGMISERDLETKDQDV